MPNFTASDLTEFAACLFVASGVSRGDAEIVARSLVGANLRGHDSHGVMRIPQYIGFLERGEYRIGVELTVVHEAPAVLACDGQWGLGQVQCHRLLDRIIPKAQKLGLSAGTIRDCGHIGRLGEYAERVADEGMILVATVNNAGSGHRVAPPGGREPRLGTNPLCVAVPTGDAPVVLDFGTSVVAEGKVRVHHISRRPVPDGWLLDHEGRPTNNPAVLYDPPLGSILPMGGAQAYKGFGLSLILDMLAGGLSGGHCCHPGAPAARGNDVLFVILDPAHFAGLASLNDQSSILADYVRKTPLVDGADRILLPGDPERLFMEKRSTQGIPLDESHWTKLQELAQHFSVQVPDVMPGF